MVVEFAALFLTGILAGEEFVIRYGVRGPLAALDDRSHIQFRQGLIRTLRVLVPAIFLPAFVTGIISAILVGNGFLWAGVLALLTWILLTIFGTIPINESASGWRPEAPPANWKALIDRWERLNTVRAWAAILAFACLVTAAALSH